MEYRNLGRSGLKVSVIGLGTNQFGGKVDQAATTEIISAALDQGINFIDTADVYQKGNSETTIGVALKGRRSQAIIATKLFHPTGEGPNDRGASRHHILEAVDASLKRLQTDYIDLYQVHRWDVATPVEETMRALDDLIRMGKVRYLGASNYSAWQLTHANAVAASHNWESFVSIQPHYHLFEREIEQDLIPACDFFNIGILPYFPLAGGFLTGKYKQNEPAPPGSRGESSQYVQKYMTPQNFEKLDKLTVLAKHREHNLNELAHAWLAAQPKVSSVISGVTRVEHVAANAKAGSWVLDPDTLAQIKAILDGSE